MHQTNILFCHFQASDYPAVCDFFLRRANTGDSNWNWARWEWMYYHPYFDLQKEDTIGLWWADDQVVGIALYDLFYGEAFCDVLEDYADLLPEIFGYAINTFCSDDGICFFANGHAAAILEKMGLVRSERGEVLSRCELHTSLPYSLPERLSIRSVHFPADNLNYQRVIWKGFDHEGDDKELNKMLRNSHRLPPHRNEALCLSVQDDTGEFVAHCTCWYDPRTAYAYVEPVCVVPHFRGKGLGKAIVCETLNRCRLLGAQYALVLSDTGFYRSLGFAPIQTYHPYRLEATDR